jgi:hypothetical protein
MDVISQSLFLEYRWPPARHVGRNMPVGMERHHTPEDYGTPNRREDWNSKRYRRDGGGQFSGQSTGHPSRPAHKIPAVVQA